MENYYCKELNHYSYFIEESENKTKDLNEQVLNDFYKAVDFVLNKRFEDVRELQSNTINPAQQCIFTPLREYRVLKNGHYKTLKIFARGLGGCLITESK